VNSIPVQGGQLPPVAANPVPTVTPTIPSESAFLTAPAPAMPDMSGLSKFGQSVQKYMQTQGRAQSRGLGMSSGQGASEAAANAGHEVAPEVQGGAYGTPPPFGGGPPSLSGAPSTPPEGP
jgi:hypothetical protein